MTQQGFQQALQRLVNDASFRQKVESDPSVLQSDFSLDDNELGVLREVRSAAGGGSGVADDSCCCCCC
jgi:hypothetical protein